LVVISLVSKLWVLIIMLACYGGMLQGKDQKVTLPTSIQISMESNSPTIDLNLKLYCPFKRRGRGGGVSKV
jgi:hypothetical protein